MFNPPQQTRDRGPAPTCASVQANYTVPKANLSWENMNKTLGRIVFCLEIFSLS